jgi:transcriptional regulator GlxA family with amidase domain
MYEKEIEIVVSIVTIGIIMVHKSLELSDKEKDRINDAITYISDHYSESFPPSELAKRINLPIRKLQFGLKAACGLDMQAIQFKIRTQKARDLMDDPKLDVAAISQMVGFNQVSVFYSLFKRYYKQSPQKYRSRLLTERNSNAGPLKRTRI